MIKFKLLGALGLLVPGTVLAEPAEISQQRPGHPVDQPLLEKGEQKGPDERILWRLFHAGKIKELNRQIEHLQRLYPYWQVPPDMIRGLQDRKRAGANSSTGMGGRRQPATGTAKTSSRSCPDPFAIQQKAETYNQKDRSHKAFELFRHLLMRCRSPEYRLRMLEKAESALERADFDRLLDLAGPYLPAWRLDRLRLQALKNEYLSNKPLNARMQDYYVSRLKTGLTLDQDDELAAVIAWRYYELQDYSKAINWFRHAIAWNSENRNVTYGLLLSLERLGDYERALTVYTKTDNPSADMDAVAGRIYQLKAWQALAAKDLVAATENVKLARSKLNAGTDLKELEAWISDQNRRYAEAAKLFDELYRQSPSRKYARAYVRNQAVIDGSRLDSEARQAGGLLMSEYNVYRAQQLYYRKQFLSAHKLAPSLYPQLQNIDSASAEFGGFARFKSGEDGLGRLDLFRMPVAGFNYTALKDHTFKLSLSRVELYSGRPVLCQSDIGSLTPEASSKIACRRDSGKTFAPIQRLDHGLEIDFSYRKDGWFSPFIRLGSTPIGGLIGPAVTFDVGFVQQTGYGHWSLEAYSQPVRQSILSYTGIKDPYRGSLSSSLNKAKPESAWGRVLSTGVRASLFYRFNDAWNASGAVDYAGVHGENVDDNSMISVSASIGRNLKVSGFDYITVGPSFNYQHFDKNLSHFTLGHGGYFSPEQYYNSGAGVNFLTEEGRSYVIKGRVGAGFQTIKESASPWFPKLDPSLGSYSSRHESGEALDIELSGVWLLTPHIQLGGGGAIRKTSGFEDYTGGVFIRYFFESRQASLSTDIPSNMFSVMY
ncbi:MAG: cellulose synthase subunit BcsC-related outer membrane protein [Gammaproteobacteria bacterium]